MINPSNDIAASTYAEFASEFANRVDLLTKRDARVADRLRRNGYSIFYFGR